LLTLISDLLDKYNRFTGSYLTSVTIMLDGTSHVAQAIIQICQICTYFPKVVLLSRMHFHDCLSYFHALCIYVMWLLSNIKLIVIIESFQFQTEITCNLQVTYQYAGFLQFAFVQ